MKSYEALQKAINGKTVEHARKLVLSTSLVNKWQEPSTDFTDSGALNPLDRIETVCETALSLRNPDALSPIHYLARRFNLILIPIPQQSHSLAELSHELLKTVKEFGDVAQSAASALMDGCVTRQEAERIEAEIWDMIKQATAFMERVKEAAETKTGFKDSRVQGAK